MGPSRTGVGPYFAKRGVASPGVAWAVARRTRLPGLLSVQESRSRSSRANAGVPARERSTVRAVYRSRRGRGLAGATDPLVRCAVTPRKDWRPR